jgi:[ribosomal protein S5]-alanine N-acetyltransferase
MKPIVETERLILRELLAKDAEAMFAMDCDPDVHKFLGNNPIQKIEETIKTIEMVRQQYLDNGIGRWAMIEKSSGEFVGWTGLKFMKEPINNHINFYETGYRLAQKHWNKGYATESTKAALHYAFEQLNTKEVFGITHVDNIKSRRALEKSGLKFIEQFVWHDWDNLPCNWHKITKNEWLEIMGL